MKMLGPMTHICPYGRHCTDNPAPGKDRTQSKRITKRREKQKVARDLRKGAYDD